MSFACIFVPNFPVAAVLRAEPDLRSQPVAVLEGKPPLEKVLAVNGKAESLAIAAGMTKAQAELCTNLVLRSQSSLQEAATHAALLDCAQSFSPCVEDSAGDTVLLDLSGMESLLGPLTEIACAMQERAIELGLKANVAVAENPDAALVAARGFSGVTVIPADKEASRLGSLPLKVLFSESGNNRDEGEENARLLETFERWGVRNLQALAALPEIALSERLGQKGLQLQQLARGSACRTLVPVQEPFVFEEGIELEHPIVLLEPLAFVLNRLLEQICARLGSRALATQELRLTLDLDSYAVMDEENFGIPSESDGSSDGDRDWRATSQPRASASQKFSRVLRLPLPMLDPKLFLKLLQLDLNAHPPGAPIVKVHLAAEPVRPRSAQAGLFVPPSPEPEKLELTLARIANMVGADRVGAVELLDTHRPEGFRMRRFMAQTSRQNGRSKESPALENATAEEKSPLTALRRFRPPLRVNVTLESGIPVRIICVKKKDLQGIVLWKAGPWRFSGDWWEREAWARDEWDIALQSGETLALFRLVHDLLGGAWFLEGTYD